MKNIGKFIVVEGPDGSGKTTIAKAFAERIHALYFERPRDLKADTLVQHEPEYYENIGRKLSTQIKKKLKKSDVVIARYVYSISALIYANTGIRRPFITDVVTPDLIVYCYAPSDILMDRVKKRSKLGVELYSHEKDVNKFKRLCVYYEDLFNNVSNVIRLDTTRNNVAECINEIVIALK